LARIEWRVPVKRFLIRVVTGLAAASLFLGTAAGAAAASVDPSTLTPPPPPDARCHTAGNQVICDTVLNFDMENEPAFDAPCGTLYLTGTDYRDGFRFYNSDGLMTRRHVTGQVNGTLSLSPTGDGPTVRMTGHLNWWGYWPVPGSAGDGVQTNHGVDIKISGPGLASDFMLAGSFLPDGTVHGHLTAFTDDAFALLCEALGA
jgi:hypothetical protein